jgi:hypothetical protein
VSYVRIEKPRAGTSVIVMDRPGLEVGSLQAAIELESHTQLFVRLTTQNFEEATRARKEGRAPVFKD